MLGEIFQIYSKYSGRGILMVLFFIALFYIALVEKKHTIRTMILCGSVFIILFIFLQPIYYIYITYVDASTYWRMWWIVPAGIGLAYVGTQLISGHRWTGFFMVFIVLLLGGEFVYTGNAQISRAENIYQIPDEVVTIVDYLEEYDEGVVFAAFPPEMLIYVRQYDVDLRMPYGREMLDMNWSGANGFYQLMASMSLDFAALAEKCEYNYTRYIIVDSYKQYLNTPEENGYRMLLAVDKYRVYEYTEVDWEQRREELSN